MVTVAHSAQAASLAGRVAGPLDRVFDGLRMYLAYRHTHAVLAKLPADRLRDLGLCPGDLRTAARMAVYGY